MKVLDEDDYLAHICTGFDGPIPVTCTTIEGNKPSRSLSNILD